MIKHFCDRCGNEIPKNGQKTYIVPKDRDGDKPRDMQPEYELCLDCKEKLKEFLGGEEYA